MALCIRPGGFSVSNKKRKRYSPIVWDRDVWDRDDRVRKLFGYSKTCSHKQFTNNFLSTGRFHTSTATRQPVVVKSIDAGHDKDCVELPDVRSCQWVHDVEEGAEKGIKVKSCQFGQPVVVKSGQYAGHDKVEYENCDVRSCRWGVDDLEEGEIRDSPVDEKGIKVVTSKMGVYNKLTSPPFVGQRREGSEGKSSESSALTHDCDMEVVGHLDSDTSVETPKPALQGTVNMLPSCRNVNEYENLGKLGEGTYGVVYKARNKKTGEFVALKKVKMNNDSEQGFPLTALREIKILFSSHHPSLINLIEVVEGSSSDSVFLVMEHMDYDLGAVLRRRKRQLFSQSEVKCLMLQLLQGVKYLHDNRVLHRDLKTSNLLLNRRGELKICDLGMARQYGNQAKPLTQLVVTLWYRAPELLLGAKQYSTAVDMWSVGCIMAELLLNQPLFNGNDEINQIDKIFRVLGTPNETSWPGFSQLPKAKARFVQQPYNLLRKKFPSASFTGAAPLSNAGFDLLNKLLACDPAKRITADEALNHQWFREFPLPKSKDCMPTF